MLPLATKHAASHAVDVADRGHTGPVKNGDAFERLYWNHSKEAGVSQ